MWIIPKQLHTSASALDTKALGLDSEEFSQICERSLTWRGKDSLSRTWLQRWKRENWMQHLCSRTLRPSLTGSFVDAWTSSVVASRANHSVLLESVTALKIQDTFSHTSPTESESANLELFSLKTLKESSQPRQQTENQFSSMSSESWKAWVTEQRQEYSQRVKSERLTRESESSSLAWPTASVAGCVEGGVAKNVEMTSSGFKATRENGTSYGAKLRDSVIHHEKNWPTMTVKSGGGLPPNSQSKSRSRKQHAGHPLETAVMREPQNWPTASARDWKDTAGMSKERDGKALGRIDQLPRAVYHHDGHQDQANHSTTGKSQESQGKLNPDWVEQLMGLPVGWTDLGSWEME